MRDEEAEVKPASQICLQLSVKTASQLCTPSCHLLVCACVCVYAVL